MSGPGAVEGGPGGGLIPGIILVCVAVASAFAGKTAARYTGWVYRAKEPGTFGFGVAVYFLAGAYLIWRSLS